MRRKPAAKPLHVAGTLLATWQTGRKGYDLFLIMCVRETSDSACCVAQAVSADLYKQLAAATAAVMAAVPLKAEALAPALPEPAPTAALLPAGVEASAGASSPLTAALVAAAAAAAAAQAGSALNVTRQVISLSVPLRLFLASQQSRSGKPLSEQIHDMQ